MIQDLFFGTIYTNLQYLASDRTLLRSLGCRSATIKELRKVVRETSNSIRAYDVTFDSHKKVRIFLGFSNGNTEKDYKDVKHQLRCWNQLNGFFAAEEGVVDGVVIIGAPLPWCSDVKPTALDLPSCVKGHLLYSPSAEEHVHFGHCTQVGSVNQVLKKLLLPINYQERLERIRDFSRVVITSGPFGFMGYPTLKRVAEKLGVEIEEIGRTWLMMEAEGLLTIRALPRTMAPLGGTFSERMYIEGGISPWLRRMWRKMQVKSNCLNFK